MDLPFQIYVLLGVMVGILSSTTGTGGGALMVPIFTFMGLDIRYAISTSKVIIVLNTISATIAYYRLKKIDYKLGLPLCASIIPSSYIGAYMVSIIDPLVLRIIVGIVIMLSGIRGLLSHYWNKKSTEYNNADNGNKVLHGFIAGIIAGFIAGIAGIGGGIVIVPFLGLLLNYRSSKPCLHLSIYIVLDTVRFITVSAEPPTGAFLAPLGNPAVTNKLLELRSL